MEIKIPEALEAGAYANGVMAWHSSQEFTLDFVVSQPDESPDATSVRVVARVIIPLTMMFDLMRLLNSAMTAYEEAYGPIRRPERRGDPADEIGGPE